MVLLCKWSNVNDPSDLSCQEAETCRLFQTAVTSLLFNVPSRNDLPGAQEVRCIWVTIGFMVLVGLYPGLQNSTIHIGLLLKKKLFLF